MKYPKKNSVLDKRHIGVTVIGKAGEKTWLYVNDLLADSAEIRIDGKHDYIDIEVPSGPIELRTEAVGAGGRIYKATRNVHIVGPPDSMVVDQQNVEMPADGQSVETLKITVMDAWGYKINRLKIATVSLKSGEIVNADIDTISDGHQIPVEDSEFSITVKSAKEVGRENLTLKVGTLEAEIPIRYTTPLTEFILVGSMDAAISAVEFGEKNQEIPKFTLADYSHQEGDLGDVPISGRLAFYAKGSMMKKYQVTASYDSRRTRDNQLFRDLDPDKQYALYGDASTLMYDAQTQSKFYGRIEQNESFIQIGDYNTNLRNTEFAKYDRSFTGLYSQLHYGAHQLTSFATLNDRTMKLDEIRGEGISGYYYLSGGRITQNSDKIRIEMRDRYHPERVLRSEEKVRYSDYDINYVDGTLMFKQPVPSIDGSGNPVYIVASYEYQSNSAKLLITGLRYDGAIKKMKLGSTFIMEEKNPSNYYLYGADAMVPIGSWLQVKGEIAQSRTSDYTENKQTGNAWSTEVELKPHKSVSLNGYYRKVDEDFLNASQTGSRFEVGAEKYGTLNSFDFGKFGRIRSEYYKQLTDVGTVNENHTDVTNAFYEYQFSNKTTGKVGYENSERKKAGNDSLAFNSINSNMLKAEVTYQWNKRLFSSLEHAQNLANETGSMTMPTGTSIGLSYLLNEKVQLFMKQRFISKGERKAQTILGIDSKVGKTTTMTGKYEIGGATGEDLSRATIGLRNKWEVRKDLAVNIAFESAATIDSLEVPTADHNSLSLGVEYLPDKPWKSSGKYEIRQDRMSRRTVWTLGGEIKVRDGLSAINLFEYSGAKYLKTSDEVWNRSNTQFGVAYRPEKNDQFNGIAKVQLLHDKNTHVAPKTELNRTIISTHGYWQASARLEFGLRFALRQLFDEEVGFFRSRTTTSLYSIRGEYEWAKRWSTGLSFRFLHLSPVNQTKHGVAMDINYLLRKNTQVGVGYIFRDLKDPDFSFSEYAYSNFYLQLRMKFGEEIFNWR